MPIRILTVIAVLLASLLRAEAQAAGALQFHRLTHTDGLLHDNVTSIAQDSIGFIWLGTHRGLNRYDGYRVEAWKYTGDEINSVFFNRIYAIARDEQRLWLATEAGLACFDTASKEYAPIEPSDNLVDTSFYRNVRYVHDDCRPGHVWLLAGKTFRLAKADADGRSVYLKPVKIGNSNCFESEGNNPRVASDADGRVWFSGCPSLESYREDSGGNIVYTGHVPGVSGYNVKAMLRDNGSLWIAYNDRILRCDVLPDGMLQPADEVIIPTSVGINSIAAAPQFIWVAAQDGAFCLPKENPSDFDIYKPSSSDSRSVIRDINNVFVDNFANVWLSGWESGVAFANPMSGMFGTLRFPSESEQSTGEFVSSLHAADDGYIYVGSKFGGIGRINAITKNADWNFSRDPALMRNNIPAIESDSRYVYAAVDNGVIIIDKASGKSAGRIATVGGGYIFWIAFDRFGRMWLATYAGLECFEKAGNGPLWHNRFALRATSPPPLTLTTDMLHNICSDTEHNQLIVTSAMGINRVILDDGGRPVRVVTYTAADGSPDQRLSSNYLWPIAKADQDDTFWIGSMGSGLNKVAFIDRPDGSFAYTAKHFGTADGAVSDDIESIQLDRFGRVWCAGPSLGYFDENVGRFNYYDTADGLQGNLFGTSSATADRNGTLWFGGAAGINHFAPTRESSAPVRAGVVFSLVNAGGKLLQAFSPDQADITLDYPDNNFSVDFTTLSFTTSNHVRYRYRLEGYENEWHYVNPGERPEASYAKLPHKRMKLVVEAGDWQDWSGTPTVLTINSRGPWWSSWWAIAAYALLGIALIIAAAMYLIRRQRSKQAIAIQLDKEEHQKEIMQMKMRFFTDVSHEFRTPLTLIRHAAGELQRHSDDSDRYVRIISRNAGVLTNMVNELLDFHRADMKSTPLRTTLTSVVPMISAIVEEFRGWAEDSEISVNVNFADPDIEMWLDREQISKVLSNIISNSIRYTDGPGTIDISVATGLYQDVAAAFPNRVSLVSDMVPGRQLIIKIKDSGIGIAAESLAVIFERFKQTHGNSGSSAGSGIGLSLVKHLIELHRGGIVASSQEGVGTEIIIFIPMTYDYLTPEQKVGESAFSVKDYLNTYGAEYEKIERRAADLSNGEPTGRPTVLVVDDNVEILDLLSDFFSSDYDVVTAETAEEAIEKASKNLPDLIISDIMMPGMDGMAFCAKLKNDLRTCHIPVVLLTAMAHEENQIEGIEIGADAYIAKPFNPRLLTATVRNLLARSRRTAPAEASTEETQPTSQRGEIADRKQQELFNRFVDLARQNFTNYDYTVENLWKDLGINRTRLYSLVKENTGMSLGNYIKKLKLELAADLLLSTDLSIAQVAFSVGIESHAYFSRSFHAQYGMSPTEWIKSHQKQ